MSADGSPAPAPARRPRAEIPAALRGLLPAQKPVLAVVQPKAAGEPAEVLIYGAIGYDWWKDWDAEQNTADRLVAEIQAITAPEILVRINSLGGDVFEGLPIYNALRNHPARITTRCEGVAASMGANLMMAGDAREAFPNAMFMTHAVWSIAMGDANEMRSQADMMDKLTEQTAAGYARVSNRTAAEEKDRLMDGTDHWFTADEFLAEGYLTAVLPDAEKGAAATPTPAAKAVAAIREAFPHATPAGAAAMARLFTTPAPAASASPVAAPVPTPVAALAPVPSQTAKEQPSMDEETKPTGAENKPADPVAIANAALAADKTRRAEIEAAYAPFVQAVGIAPILKAALDDNTCTVDTARARLLSHMGAQASPTAHIIVGTGDRDHFIRNAGDYLAFRAGVTKQLPENAREFVGDSMLDIAKKACAQANIRTAGMSRDQIAIRALTTTSDLPTLLTSTASRSVQAGYASQAKTFDRWAVRRDFPDFKETREIIFAPNVQLKRVAETEEYSLGTSGESAEPVRVQKYGRLFAYSWEALINDNLDAFGRLPAAFGAAAATLESDLVYAVLARNLAMTDGFPLFSAQHGNVAGTVAPLSEASIEAATIYFNNRRNPEGNFMALQPQVLLVPPSLAFLARRILGAPYSSQGVGTQATDTPNVVKDLYEIVVDPRVAGGYPDPNSANGLVPAQAAYYFLANPLNAPVVRYGYLEGYSGPVVETFDRESRDSFAIKCRHCFGAGAVGSIGAYKVPNS